MASSFTKINPKAAQQAAVLLACTVIATPAAFGQGGGFYSTKTNHGDLQDASQFYMSRRQVQVVDDSPIVKFGNGPGAGSPGGSGAVPTGAQMALPRAGFQSYSSSAPSITTPLPKVNNGVPPKPTPAEEAAMKAKAESLRKSQAKAAAAAAPKAPPPPEGIKAYNSYKGYNPAAALPVGASSAGGTNSSSVGQVKGNVLHWNKKRKAE